MAPISLPFTFTVLGLLVVSFHLVSSLSTTLYGSSGSTYARHISGTSSCDVDRRTEPPERSDCVCEKRCDQRQVKFRCKIIAVEDVYAPKTGASSSRSLRWAEENSLKPISQRLIGDFGFLIAKHFLAVLCSAQKGK
ncbi:hypothetical protein ZHAS_00002879 [Anopheles sinensis]|uniref:Uncharacterized protein n=1 Tax=Anopheles sinensis TaxID=74873 RepID=A0A084VD80_ANOSI|nr:hypothetical protein ZHAS_00002879 [Anopheles sinensis]